MNTSLKLVLGCMLLVGSAYARVTKDKAFIDAVRYGDKPVIGALFNHINSRKTFDRALRAAARNGDHKLFNQLKRYSSHRGRRKGQKSLDRHTRVYFSKLVHVG